MDVTPLLYLIGAFLSGFIIAWFAGRGGPVYALEKASAEIEALRQKLQDAENELRKTQGHLRENLATLDEMAEERRSLVQQLKAAGAELSNARAEIEQLRAALGRERDAHLLLKTELTHTRGAFSTTRQALTAQQVASLNRMGTDDIPKGREEKAALAEQPEESEPDKRLAALEQEVALARAAAARLAEKEALVSAELFLRQRAYRDILAGGEDAILAALAARDRALADAQAQLDSLRRDLGMFTAAGAQLAAALEKRNSEYTALLNRIAAEETARHLETALTTEMQPAEEALTPADGLDLSEALAARTAELDDLRSEYERLKMALEQTLADREALQQALEARVAEVGSLNDQVAAMHTELQALIAEKDALSLQLQTRVDSIAAAHAKAEAELAALRQTYDALAQARDGLEAQLAACHNEVTALQNRVEALQGRLQHATKEVDEARTELQMREAEIKRLQTELAEAAGWQQRAPAIAEFGRSLSLINETKLAAANSAIAMNLMPKAVRTPQDLGMVKGIGRVYEQRLYEAGIGTYWELANLSNEEMERILQVNPLQKLRLDFDAIRADAERLAQETNTVGQLWSGEAPDDFEPIEGIGKIYERRLYEAGIRTYRDLASTTPERLAEIIKPRPPAQPDFAHWIAQARQLAEATGQ
ncbi:MULTISPECIES: helix-hairpin-helix domain-containing protein [Caldilinea]|uniref:helix-hairpin-helix domain-containing protein n=1 Tax=Caldilinea TaxID=233191 RepID=UPI0002EF12E7|nr:MULTISPECIES: helix-hairpin-helix domain-containing protein [Caldilinea]GIV71745.1 MAG: hypothetical protein KatS3mg049_0301 [Caldilinea sp.]